MPTIAVWSKLTDKSRSVAFAVCQDGLARVFYHVTEPYSARPGEFTTAPIKLPDAAFPKSLATVTLDIQTFGMVTKGPADFKLKIVKVGGYDQKATAYVETTGDHAGFHFIGTVKELYWLDSCPLGTGEEIYTKLMGTKYANGPTTIPGAPMPRARPAKS